MSEKDRAAKCAEDILNLFKIAVNEEGKQEVVRLIREAIAEGAIPIEAPPSKPKKRRPVPKGLRRILGDEIACPHRELSCCPACVALHENLVAMAGHHYWVPDLEERKALIAKLEAKRAST